MAAKFKLTIGALPDFKLPVKFVMPNGQETEVVFTAKHRKVSDIQELLASKNVKDTKFISEIVSGWDIEDEFNEENVKELLSYFPGIPLQLSKAYMEALAGLRVKN